MYGLSRWDAPSRACQCAADRWDPFQPRPSGRGDVLRFFTRRITLMFVLLAPLPATATAQAVPSITPTVVVSGEKADLSQVAFVAVCGSAGEINVGLSQESTIRRFTATGVPIGSFGRRGAGPGEISGLSPFAFCRGDTLGFGDHALARLTLVSPNLKLVRSVPFPRIQWASASVGAMRPMSVAPHGLNDDGVVVFGFNTSNIRSVTGHVLVVSGEGMVKRQLLDYPADPTLCNILVASGQSYRIPFCSLAWAGNDPTLRLVALVSSTAAQQDRGAYQLRVVGIDGKVRLDREIVATIDRIQPAEFEAEAKRRAYPPEGAKAVRDAPKRRRYGTAPPVLAAQDGSVWVLHRTKTAQHWSVTDPRGQLVAQVQIPLGVVLFSVTRNTAIGVMEDENGFQDVVKVDLRILPRQ